MSEYEEEIEIEMFYCESCKVGWFAVKEETKSSGSILNVHKNLNHDLKFSKEKKPKLFWEKFQ